MANATTHPGAGGKASGASALALTRAMPDRAEMAAVLRQLLRAANRTDVRLDSVTPQAAAAQSGYSAVPMDVVVTGRYSGVQRFLRHLRTQAGVAGPHVHAAGRLFSVDSVNLAAGEDEAAAARGHDPPERLHLQRVGCRRHAGDAQHRARLHHFELGHYELGHFELGGCRRGDARMSTLETHMAGRRVAAPNADRRKKLLLVGLFVLLAGLLAFQLPKLLKSSDSSSTHRFAAGRDARDRQARRHRRPVGREPPDVRAREAPARHPAHDAARPVRAAGQRERPRVGALVCSGERPRVRALICSGERTRRPHHTCDRPGASAPTQPAPGVSAPTQPDPAPVKPGPVGSAEPTAAVIWTNGKRHIVGVGQTFVVGDATFKLAAVGDKSMRLQVTGGSFADGKRTITVPEGREVTLENEATGVRYTLRFAGGTTERRRVPTGQATDRRRTSNGS